MPNICFAALGFKQVVTLFPYADGMRLYNRKVFKVLNTKDVLSRVHYYLDLGSTKLIKKNDKRNV